MSPRALLHAGALLALLVPAIMLVSARGPVIALYVLTLLAPLYALRYTQDTPRAWRPRVDLPSDFWLFALALAAPFLAWLLSSAALGHWQASQAEKLLRLGLAVQLAWMLLRAPRTALQNVQWSLLAGAGAGAALLLIALASEPDRSGVVAYGAHYNAVHLANLVLLLGLACSLLIPWALSGWPRAEMCLKLAVLALAAAATWLSHTRSSWAVLVVYGWVLVHTRHRWSARRKLMGVGTLLAVLAGALFLALYANAGRFGELITELQRYEHGDRNSSMGIRLQLWQAAWAMFEAHPWTGVGAAGFREALASLQARGVVTPEVLAGYGEPHNDYLAALALYGLPGLASMIALYFIPAVLFFRRMASRDAVVRVAASIGLLYTLGYAAFSTTEMMFRNMRSVPGYAVTVALLYALANTRRNTTQSP